MKMPNPIAIRFAKLIFSILSITVLGVIFAMISHDHICLTIPIRKNEHLPYLLTQACLPCVIAWSSMATASVVA